MPLPPEDVATALRVLQAIVEDRRELATLDAPTRRALIEAAGRASRPDRHEVNALRKRLERNDRASERAHDRAVLDRTQLRAQRKTAPLLLVPPPEAPGVAALPPPDDGAELHNERACYVCKKAYVRPHRFYGAMCEACGEFNLQKRTQTADLSGQVALVTGARVKIGYQASLYLLRAGATVIATTRFPHDAALRYAREPDFGSFRDRLKIYGVDLRHFPSVEQLCGHLLETEARLDHLINNACQTVRRPPGWYRHLLPTEALRPDELPPEARPLVAAHDALVARLGGRGPASEEASLQAMLAQGASGLGIVAPAQLSLVPLPGEEELAAQSFPSGRYDLDAQQVDLRDRNSWRLTLAEVPTAELLEVHLVNAVAPFLLNARLKPLMLRVKTGAQHVVNVSAMEGQFYRAKKTDRHPHTNMAKAALNMMTRTSAPDYVKDGLHMNAVDTGWVTDEDPVGLAERKVLELNFAPPLDAQDGAARIVDPIFGSANTGVHVWGQFLKDYRPAPW